MSLDGCGVEWFHPQAKVVHVATRSGWRTATGAAKYSVHGHEVDERAAGPKLSQSNLFLLALYLATQHTTIEPEHLVEIDNSNDNVINLSYVNH